MKMGKKIIYFLSIFLIGGVAFFSSAYAATGSGSGTLVVSVTGVKNDQGVVRISIYNSEATYKAHTPGGGLRTGVLPVHNGHAVWRVTNLPYGDYAVLFYHDEDNSHVFKKNVLGIPKEGYGWSGEGGGLGLPSFDNAKFSFSPQSTSVTVRMRN
jgi:uncharacterized protein (DUF2141 family)